MPDPKATSEPQTPSENPQDVLLPPPVVAQESQSQKSPTAQKQQETNDPILDVVQEDPEAIAFPLKTADALFSNHDMEKALLYYQLALKNTDVGEANNDRPWALFQTANCLRRRDPIRAIEIYNQVISEYPGHTFSSMAKILAEIIQKQQTQNPIIVLERYGYDPNSL
ncbi:MAG: tetratricopeptide repeat protein [Sedimentisphaerales bacterium]|nr:tetratricopeptide repeat protein [Sedimentisphaerales bacterium]